MVIDGGNGNVNDAIGDNANYGSGNVDNAIEDNANIGGSNDFVNYHINDNENHGNVNYAVIGGNGVAN